MDKRFNFFKKKRFGDSTGSVAPSKIKDSSNYYELKHSQNNNPEKSKDVTTLDWNVFFFFKKFIFLYLKKKYDGSLLALKEFELNSINSAYLVNQINNYFNVKIRLQKLLDLPTKINSRSTIRRILSKIRLFYYKTFTTY